MKMATKQKTRKPNQLPLVEQPRPPADPWTIHVQAKLVELEAVKAASDRKWGENRLITLVDSEMREKFWIQNSRVHQFIVQKDQVRFDAAVAGMIRAFGVLDAKATEAGLQPAGKDIARIEWEMDNGQVMVVVRTLNEALAIQTSRTDLRDEHIWSLEELEVFMMEPIVQDVIKVKAMMPTAKVTKFSATKLGGETGFDDFENDLVFSDNELAEVKFDSKAAERYKNGTN
jgi:hypothetical protein